MNKIRLIDIFTIFEMSLEATGAMVITFVAMYLFSNIDILVCMFVSACVSVASVFLIAIAKGELYEERHR